MAVKKSEVPHSVLTEHVFESNWIEGYPPYDYPETTALFKCHLKTAKTVVSTWQWEPIDLHFSLLDGTGMLPPEQVGIFRKAQVYIGNFYPPSPGRHLLNHVTAWRKLVEAGPQGDPEQWCWEMHDHFETIHPFIDGNGRTGRLILNALRLRYGLPWLIVHHGEEQQKYYAHIRRWQSTEWRCGGNDLYSCQP